MKTRKYWQLAVLFFFWVFAFFPLFGNRFIPTHDGEYHLIRIHEFSQMLSSGNLIPRWAPGLNSGYGFPLFVFHYPFPNYIGSVFHLVGLPLVQSFQLGLAFGVLVATLGWYFFLQKEYEDRYLPLIGSMLFLTIPYLFVDVYIRGSIGEVWAIAWVVCGMAALVWKKYPLFAICTGLLIVSHNIMAMIMVPLLLGYIFFFYREALLYMLLGILSASYFWIPALLERAYVVGLNSVTYSDHFPDLTQLLFPSWGSTFSQPGIVAGEMSQQIGIISLCIMAITIMKIIKVIKNRRITLQQKKYIYFFCITVFALGFILPFSHSLWKLFPFLQYIQYPWRLLSILLITMPFLGVEMMKNFSWGVRLAIMGIALFASFWYMQPVTYEPRSDEYYLTKKEFTDGTSSLGNSFSTIWTPWKQERFTSRVEVGAGDASISPLVSTSRMDRFTVASQTDSIIRVHRLYYPGWTVWVNKAHVPMSFANDGIISFSVPMGRHDVSVVFGSTPTRMVANIISLGSLGMLLVSGILKLHYAHRN